MGKKSKMPDLIAGVVLLVISVYVFYGSLNFPIYKWAISPGLVPGIFSGLLGILSIIILVKSIREMLSGGSGDFSRMKAVVTDLNSEFYRLLLPIVFISIYIFVGLPLIGFFWSSAIFIFSAILFFSRRFSWIKGLLISVLSTIGLYLIFVKLFKLPMNF